jgi:signal transduction histidine kinase
MRRVDTMRISNPMSEVVTASPPARSALRTGALLFAAALAFWLVVGLADSAWYYFVGTFKGGKPVWSETLKWNLPYWVVAALLTLPVVWIARATSFRRDRWLGALLIHLVAFFGFAGLHVFLFLLAQDVRLGKPIDLVKLFGAAQKYLSSTLDKEILLYLVIAGVVRARDYYVRYRERARVAAALELERAQLKASLSEAQLDALRRQLQPHFLFNALHAISTLIMRGDNQAANQMLLRLSQFLRMTLEGADAQVVSLGVELEFLDAYLRIQRVRFGDRLRVVTEIADETRGAEVPNLLLQPLVENAIRHGIGADPGRGTITLRAGREGGWLRLEVLDDGPGLPPDGSPAEGVGLANIRARLAQLYPERHSFALEAAPGGGVRAVVTIPFVPATGAAAEAEEGMEDAD